MQGHCISLILQSFGVSKKIRDILQSGKEQQLEGASMAGFVSEYLQDTGVQNILPARYVLVAYTFIQRGIIDINIKLKVFLIFLYRESSGCQFDELEWVSHLIFFLRFFNLEYFFPWKQYRSRTISW